MRRLLFIIAIALSMVILTGAVKGPRVGPGGQGLVVGMPSDVGRRGAVSGGIWNGFDYVIVFTMDDGFLNQKELTAAADSMNFPMTYAPHVADTTDIGYLDVAEWFSRGVEISATGNPYDHDAVADPAHNLQWGALRYAETLAASYEDSLRGDINPSWVEDWTGVDYGINTFVIDIGQWSYDALGIAKEFSLGVRGGYHTNTNVGGGGRVTDPPGSPRWDGWQRLLSVNEPSLPYGFGSFGAAASSTALEDSTEYVFGGNVNNGGLASDPDSIAVRADRLLYDVVDANNSSIIVIVIHGDVTREELEGLVEHAWARGDTEIMALGGMLTTYTAATSAVDAPGWAAYGRLEGIVAADEIFRGPALTFAAATDSYFFHNGNPNVVIGAGHDQEGDSLSFGNIRPDLPTTVSAGSTDLQWDTGALPLITSRDIALLAFDIDAVDGKEIVGAYLDWYTAFVLSDRTATTDFVSITGVTVPEIIDSMIDESGTDTAADVCYDFKQYLGGVGSVPWVVGWDTYLWTTEFGEYSYPMIGFPIGTNTKDVLDYILYAQENDLARVVFLFSGHIRSGSAAMRLSAQNDAQTNQRPVLRIITAD